MTEEQGSFETAIERLESIVKRLESDSTALDDALQLFEEGVRLSRFCTQKLDEVEQKVQLLIESRDGSLSLAPLDADAGG